MPRDWSQASSISAIPANRGLDHRIAAIAGRQQGLIRAEQLRDLPLSASAIRSRASTGRLHRVHPRVFALHPPPYSYPQRWLAAVYTCGPGAALSDFSAASHLGIWETPPPVAHVTSLAGRGRGRQGITVHRRRLDTRDVMPIDGIPCTSVARTVLDCAAALSDEAAEDLLMAADASGKLNRRRLEELIADHPNRPGTRHLRDLIAEGRRITRSENERRLFAICRRFGLSLPRTEYPVQAGGRTFIADFCWPELGLIVEADSRRWHGGRSATESDRERDQILSIAGWRIVRFSRNAIKRRPAEVGARLAALTGRPALAEPGAR